MWVTPIAVTASSNSSMTLKPAITGTSAEDGFSCVGFG
jgi:hypothetical protein